MDEQKLNDRKEPVNCGLPGHRQHVVDGHVDGHHVGLAFVLDVEDAQQAAARADHHARRARQALHPARERRPVRRYHWIENKHTLSIV